MFKLFKSSPAPEAAKPEPTSAPCDTGCGDGSAASSASDDAPFTGCLVCGEDLVYLPASTEMACVLCGAAKVGSARCKSGHFACDACHAAPAMDVIEKVCASTDERDPMALALRMLRNPAVKLHGPEHHFLVPAVLLAAYSNVKREPQKRAERVAEARRRVEPIQGGSCGLLGTCGAAIGTGAFVSIVTEATPLKGKERGLANRMTARALTVIGATDAARCCKRDSMLSILAAVKFAREHLRVDLSARGPECEWRSVNKQCGGTACPFHR
ncbi:DUF5714 domain-containing protein [Anaeromyxobacter terrae]|uniref:DUF5714 domain-containing protein n=1 Tax=Anaeromyxobacter terrae TaxID=2925406 RepID=UPI001F58A54B|nr:DUF5714 domain-containing protein [Anaeromyxobacter sp. SG22]